ncbi:hypothetical protein JTB14_009075 [Gonioctena quinquepunctata]|nr:hypothetical protein JTB14_009075 [Gonioctena quinquepunctata]
MPDNGNSRIVRSHRVAGFDEGVTGLRDNPSRAILWKRLGSDDFVAPTEGKLKIYWLKKPELMELASSLQINPEGTVIDLTRRLIWHLKLGE